MRLVQQKNLNLQFLVIGLVIFIAFIGFLFSEKGGIIHLIGLKNKRNGLIKKNHSLMVDKLNLKQTITSLYHLPTIEHLAKERLGMIHPDETIFIVKPR